MAREYYYTPEEIAQVLCEATYDDCNQDDERYINAKETIEYLKTIADNPYNDESFRSFYKLLQDFTNVNEGYLK